MRFDILTIFPEIFDSYFNTSILKKLKRKAYKNLYAQFTKMDA